MDNRSHQLSSDRLQTKFASLDGNVMPYFLRLSIPLIFFPDKNLFRWTWVYYHIYDMIFPYNVNIFQRLEIEREFFLRELI